MAQAKVKMVWYGDEIYNAAVKGLANASKKIANKVMADAMHNLITVAKTRTEKGLMMQFSISVSKFDKNHFLVYCQGPDKWYEPYHAAHMELGTWKNPAKPFMHPARATNKGPAKTEYKKVLERL